MEQGSTVPRRVTHTLTFKTCSYIRVHQMHTQYVLAHVRDSQFCLTTQRLKFSAPPLSKKIPARQEKHKKNAAANLLLRCEGPRQHVVDEGADVSPMADKSKNTDNATARSCLHASQHHRHKGREATAHHVSERHSVGHLTPSTELAGTSVSRTSRTHCHVPTVTSPEIDLGKSGRPMCSIKPS